MIFSWTLADDVWRGFPEGRKISITTNTLGYVTRLLWQPNELHGVFELKQFDPKGSKTQWYQYYVDAQGKVLIEICWKTAGLTNDQCCTAIHHIRYNLYRVDNNIAGFYEFSGEGNLRQRVEYEYDSEGNWIKGVIWNSKGARGGNELTPPVSRLYGLHREKLKVKALQ
jgi:hypothetical protein